MIEQATIKLEMDGKQAAKHRLALAVLKDSFRHLLLQDDDTLTLNWTLSIEYAKGLHTSLVAILEMLEDPKVIVNAECQQLANGQILFYEVCKQLEKVQQRLKRRDATPAPPPADPNDNSAAKTFWENYWD